jgi:hypothetical protein
MIPSFGKEYVEGRGPCVAHFLQTEDCGCIVRGRINFFLQLEEDFREAIGFVEMLRFAFGEIFGVG